MKNTTSKLTILWLFAVCFLSLWPTTARAQDSISFIKLEYTSGTTVYDSFLIIDKDEGKGIMRVRYFDDNANRTQLIEMKMTVKNTPRGVILEGGVPVDLRTGRKHPTYAADNFVIRTKPDGTTTIHNVDDRGNVSETDGHVVTGNRELQKLIRDFAWEELLNKSTPGPEIEQAPQRNKYRF